MEMGSADLVDDRTFNGDFSEEGVAKLKEMIKDKLKEYMGYTDDTLVVRFYHCDSTLCSSQNLELI